VIDIISKEKRSYVRGDVSFKVTFKVMSPEEYQDLKRSNKEIFSHDKREKGIDITDTDNKDAHITPNTCLIDFLLYMDEKLDQILAFVSQDVADKESFNQGIGSNISGSGMNIITDKPLELGKIIHTNFVLSRFPLVFIDAFGEVVRVTPVDEDGKTFYHLGAKFLDLNLNDRERIIACVFQRQREAIRKKKDERLKLET
jgi:hypothetical protein